MTHGRALPAVRYILTQGPMLVDGARHASQEVTPRRALACAPLSCCPRGCAALEMHQAPNIAPPKGSWRWKRLVYVGLSDVGSAHLSR